MNFKHYTGATYKIERIQVATIAGGYRVMGEVNGELYSTMFTRRPKLKDAMGALVDCHLRAVKKGLSK